MKNNYKLILICLVYLLSSTTFAQVYTPKGTSVDYQIMTEGNISSLESDAANWLAARGWTNLVTKTAPATALYNCHSYAWYMTEGGTNTYWINSITNATGNSFNFGNPNASPRPSPSNIERYWNDGSYLPVSESNATKVWYGATASNWTWDPYQGWINWYDHSAVRITSGAGAGKYESKWGAWPRYIHDYDKSPYSTGNRQFFIKTPVITAPTTICYGSSGSISATNWQSGHYWDKSNSLINITSTTSSSTTISAASSGSQGSVQLRVKTSSGVTIATYDVWVGAPTLGSLYPEGYYADNGGYYAHWITSVDTNISNLNWVVAGTDNYGNRVYGTIVNSWINGNYGNATIFFPEPGNYSISVRAQNSCGWSSYIDFYNFILY